MFDGNGHFLEDQPISFVQADGVDEVQRNKVDTTLNNGIHPRDNNTVVAQLAEGFGPSPGDTDAVLSKDGAAARTTCAERRVRQVKYGIPFRLSRRRLREALRTVAKDFGLLQEDHIIGRMG